jgi:NADH dehydrogenase FAD-containing subunit
MKKIIMIGGGLANFTVIQKLEAALGPEALLLIEPRDYLESPIAVLRGLMDPDGFGKTIREPWAELSKIERKSAKAIRSAGDEIVLDDGERLGFSFAIIATGAATKGFPFMKGAMAATLSDRETEFHAEGWRIHKAKEILLIGGGPVGVEMAGELIDAFPDKKISLVTDTANLLHALPQSCGRKAYKVLSKKGVIIHVSKTLTLVAGTYCDQDKKTYPADLTYNLTGIHSNSFPVDELNSLNELGQIMVNSHLQVIGRTNVLALGDVNDVPEIKLAATARGQAIVVVKNVMALLADSRATLHRYRAAKPMSFVTLGLKAGIAQTPFGRLDFLVGLKQKDLFLSKYMSR